MIRKTSRTSCFRPRVLRQNVIDRSTNPEIVEIELFDRSDRVIIVKNNMPVTRSSHESRGCWSSPVSGRVRYPLRSLGRALAFGRASGRRESPRQRSLLARVHGRRAQREGSEEA